MPIDTILPFPCDRTTLLRARGVAERRTRKFARISHSGSKERERVGLSHTSKSSRRVSAPSKLSMSRILLLWARTRSLPVVSVASRRHFAEVGTVQQKPAPSHRYTTSQRCPPGPCTPPSLPLPPKNDAKLNACQSAHTLFQVR
jgi:hypothetical protein